jgi:hypothetical protein
MNSLSRYYLFIFWVSLMPQIFNSISLSISLSLVWKPNQAESYFTTVRFRLCVVSLILANLMKGTTPQLAAIPSATSIRWDWRTFSLTTQKKFFFFFIPFFFFFIAGDRPVIVDAGQCTHIRVPQLKRSGRHAAGQLPSKPQRQCARADIGP